MSYRWVKGFDAQLHDLLLRGQLDELAIWAMVGLAGQTIEAIASGEIE